MTPEEAIAVFKRATDGLSETQIAFVSLALMVAIQEERKECAKIAETCDISPTECGYTERERIAAAIRARSKEGTK